MLCVYRDQLGVGKYVRVIHDIHDFPLLWLTVFLLEYFWEYYYVHRETM